MNLYIVMATRETFGSSIDTLSNPLPLFLCEYIGFWYFVFGGYNAVWITTKADADRMAGGLAVKEWRR